MLPPKVDLMLPIFHSVLEFKISKGSELDMKRLDGERFKPVENFLILFIVL